jgi:Flp pilus assembly protein TadG
MTRRLAYRHHSASRGSSLMETALLLPVLFLLLVGMVELARISYTYYTLQKMLTMVASYLGTRQGVNFCDEADLTVTQAKSFALTGTNEGTNTPLVPNLDTAGIRVRAERVAVDSGDLGECDCSAQGCDLASGGRAPDYVTVSLTDGYTVRVALPFINLEPIILRPQVRMPYGGT